MEDNSALPWNILPFGHQSFAWCVGGDRRPSVFGNKATLSGTFELVVNKLLIDESEDMCLSPSVWNTMSEEIKTRCVLGMRHRLFRGTLAETPAVFKLR